MDLQDPKVMARVERLRSILACFDRTTQLSLFDRITAMTSANAIKGSPVACTLLDLLNERRREHARRLWTRCLEPMIVRAPDSLVALVAGGNRLLFEDVADWWHALERRLPDLVGDIQDMVVERACQMPLDRFFTSDEAIRWAQELRRHTLDHLMALRDDPAERAALLWEVNSRRRGASGQGRRPLGLDDLDTLIAALDGESPDHAERTPIAAAG